MRRWLLSPLLLACSAQEVAQSEADCKTAAEPLMISCADPSQKHMFQFEGAPLVDVIKAVSFASCQTFLMDEHIQGTRLTIWAPAPISQSQVLQVFEASLAINDLSLVKTSAGYRIEEDRRPTPPPAPSSQPSFAEAIQQTGEHTYRVERAKLNFNEPMFADIKMIPRITDGKMTGFKLYTIRANSLWAALGFKNGDVLQSINKQPLDSLEKAMALFGPMNAPFELEVSLLRQDEPITLHYVLF